MSHCGSGTTREPDPETLAIVSRDVSYNDVKMTLLGTRWERFATAEKTVVAIEVIGTLQDGLVLTEQIRALLLTPGKALRIVVVSLERLRPGVALSDTCTPVPGEAGLIHSRTTFATEDLTPLVCAADASDGRRVTWSGIWDEEPTQGNRAAYLALLDERLSLSAADMDTAMAKGDTFAFAKAKAAIIELETLQQLTVEAVTTGKDNPLALKAGQRAQAWVQERLRQKREDEAEAND